MALREEFERSGGWLFLRRHYLPLFITPLFLIALRKFHDPDPGRVPDHSWEIVCLGLSLFGLGIRAVTIGHADRGTSGRSTKKLVADVLNTTGIYSVVRHPLYLGNFLIWLGISLSLRSLWLVLTAVLVFWLYYERIMFAEEEFLRRKFGEAYLSWAEQTPAFLPRFKNYRRPALSFSFRRILKKEYAGFSGIVALFAVLGVAEDSAAGGRLRLDRMWLIMFLSGLFVYLTLRILKKKTKLLNVEGR